MIAERMKGLVAGNSVIREMFEEGKRLASIYGSENVFDFSLGNPNVPAPDEVNEAVIDIIKTEPSTFVHGYMSNAGYEDVRQTLAQSINRKFGTNFSAKNLIMSVGAASGLNVIFKTILNPGDEVLVFAPYFLEYRSYVANYDGVLVEVSPDTESFQPNLVELEKKINEKTKAVLVNSPNNPTGVVYSAQTFEKMAAILNKKQEELGHDIFLVTDEPYRELAYDGVDVPYVTKFYANTIVGYSFSKSLSLPGERIGYIVIPDEVNDSETIITAATIATRVLGYVNAPSLFQRVVARCADCEVKVSEYDKNRKALYGALKEFGFECVKPEGAFYLFVKTPVDDKQFCDEAKKHNILVVPGTSFACPGYVRVSYCVAYETIIGSLDGFKELAKTYGLI